MYLLLLPSLSSWFPAIPASLRLKSLPRCVYAIAIFPKTPSMSSHISSISVPHLRRRRLHLPVSPSLLSLLSRISSAVIIRRCLHRCPCLSSPIFRIYTTSIVILPHNCFIPRHIVFHRPALFAAVCLCVPVSLLCLQRLRLCRS